MIYVSLTTVPIRINMWHTFKENLQSLLSQKTTEDYKVVLNIPYRYKNNNEEEYRIPEELQLLTENYSRLIINRVNEDYGPIVKITGTLEVSKDPEDLLIVCDDDHFYHEDMIEYHLKKRKEYPNSVICFRGDLPIEKRSWEEEGTKKYILRPTHVYFPVKYDCQLAIPGHWHSVGYKREFFKEDFLSIIPLSDNDDTLIGYYAKKNQIDIMCVTWEEETDWRAVNENGRGAASFPIKYTLPYPNSGFYEFRVKSGDGYGRAEKELTNFLHNHDIIFTEKNG